MSEGTDPAVAVSAQRSTQRPALCVWAAAAIDAVLIGVFAAVGRASHDEGNPVVGVLATAWPFLVGAAAGWALVHWRSGRWPTAVGTGIPVVVSAVVVGMILRLLTGSGTAISFVVVATVILAVLLLGWRLVAARLGLIWTVTNR